jgi:hypothetical protein
MLFDRIKNIFILHSGIFPRMFGICEILGLIVLVSKEGWHLNLS